MTVKPSPAKKVTIILDTNALFVPFQFKIDIFEQLKALLNTNFEPIIIRPVQRELEEIAQKGSPKMRKTASFALKLVEKCKLLKAEENHALSVDESIAEIAAQYGWAVFTNDKKLRKTLRDINVLVIYLRQKSHLEIDGRL